MHSTSPLKLLVGACSDIGPKRTANEDSGYCNDRLLVVADGVGGSVAGELASCLVVRQIAQGLGQLANPDANDVLGQVGLANSALTRAVIAEPELRGMATTMTGMVVAGDRGYLLHVGDSRAYRWRDGRLDLMTVDQSWVQMLMDSGMLDPRDARRHPMRNLLLHSLSGALSDTDAVRISAIDLRIGDRWLVATDGLTSYVPNDVLVDVLSETDDVQDAAELLVDRCWTSSRDNITALVGDVTAGQPTGRGQFLGAAASAGSAARRVV